MKIEYTPIGTVRSPFQTLEDMPIQPTGAAGVRGTVEVIEAFHRALKDLIGFSHIILLYHFHRSGPFEPLVVPFLDSEPRGLFSTRAPKRPNPIGLSVVRLEAVEHGVLHVENVDILDGTPLLDVKPYVPAFDAPGSVRTGWLEKAGHAVTSRRSDDRFT